MSETKYNKKIRTARASQIQLTAMIDFFYSNKGLAEGKFNSLHGKEETQKKWAQLSDNLNACKGAIKTAEQWQVVWRDLKSRISIKARDLRKEKALTGNRAIVQSELTEFEQRAIGITGTEYIEGSKYCADSIPDEENLLEALEKGDNSVLLATPEIISVCTNQKSSQDSQYLEDDFLHNNDSNLVSDDDCLNMNILLEHNENGIYDANKENSESGKIKNIATC